MTQTIIAPGAAVPGPVPPSTDAVASPAFIAEQTAGSLLRNTLALFRSNFQPLFLTYALPILPILLAQEVTPTSGSLRVSIAFVGVVASLFATGALTVTVSDICLGNRPTVRHSYAKLLEGKLWLRLLGTNLLQALILFVGFLLLIVPGLVLMLRLQFSATVVVLEGRAGSAALKRSLFLSKGAFWRLLGIFLVLMAPLLCVAFVLGAAIGLSGNEKQVASALTDAFMGIVVGPLTLILVVLMYYDLRARKEAYDLAALSEDMMR